ncbi:hypothetical protein PIB30_082013 [Stylosanthes scabra]|uniref:Uncharacterized protein n=1 Tax=Stylosanthes scabra TaxID=79078 RepID=A0ABU6TTT7_9FABA|nr:hypothetical protein [Stylosanthes scabra]
MARNTGSYVTIIIILIIGVVICYENVEFQKTMIEIPSTTLYPTSDNNSSSSSSKPKQTVEECVKNCRKKKLFGFSFRKKMNKETMDCIYDCVFTECSLRFPGMDPDSNRNKESCVIKLYNKYTADHGWLRELKLK